MIITLNWKQTESAIAKHLCGCAAWQEAEACSIINLAMTLIVSAKAVLVSIAAPMRSQQIIVLGKNPVAMLRTKLVHSIGNDTSGPLVARICKKPVDSCTSQVQQKIAAAFTTIHRTLCQIRRLQASRAIGLISNRCAHLHACGALLI